MRVPEYRRQIADVVPSTRIKADVPDLAAGTYKVEAAGAKALGEGLNALRLGLEVRQENQDQYQLASAVNEFRRANTEYLHARDGGVFSKKGGQTFGVSEQYDQYAQTTMDEIARRYKMNDRVRQAFIGSTNALRDSSLSSVMRYEQRETDAARELEWKTMASETLSNAALCYSDDAAFNEELNIGMGAVAQQFAPYGDEVVGRKLKEFASKCQTARVAAMLEDDPRAAEAYLKKHKGEFAGADFLRVKKAVDDRVDVLRVQETTDGLVRRFGSEAAALAHVRKHYEGGMENKLVTAVKARFGEMRIARNDAEKAVTQRQNGAFATLREEYWDNGKTVPQTQLETMYRSGRLSDSGYASALNYNRSLIDRAGKVRWAQDHIENWGALPLEQQDARIQELFGYTQQEREDYAKAFHQKALFGELSEDDIKLGYNYGLLDSREKAKAEAALKGVKAADKAAFALEQKRVNVLLKGAGLDADARMEIEKQAAAGIAELNPADPDYRENGRLIIIDAAASALSERNFRPWYKLGLGGKKFDDKLRELNSRAREAKPDEKNAALADALSFLLPQDATPAPGKDPKVFADAVSGLGARPTPKKKTPPPHDRDDEDEDAVSISLSR